VGGEDRLLRVPLRAVGGAVRGEGGQSVRPAPACDPAVGCLLLCLSVDLERRYARVHAR